MEQLAAEFEIGFAVAVGVEPIVADALKAGRDGVHQKAADELPGIEGHRALPLWVGRAVILVREADLAVPVVK